MDSVGDRVGSNSSSTLRRYTPVQSRIQCWPKGRMVSNGQPQLEGQVPRELAFQAQLAACNYLGYSPREFSNSQFRQQAISADPSRPLELHMHHHHHHYLASPTSPFSQTNSAPFFGEPELAASASNFIRNASQGLTRSHGYSESSQRSAQNVLWLKNQPAEDEEEKASYRCGQEVRGGSKVCGGGGMIRRDCGSQLSNTSDIRSIEYPNKLSWSKAYDSEQQQQLEREVTGSCGQTFAPLGHSDVTTVRVAKKQKDAGGYQSPYGSLSDETSATEESVTPTIYETRPHSERSFQGVVDRWKTNCIHGRKEDGLLGKASTLDRHNSQAAEIPLATGKMCNRHSSKPHPNGVHDEVSSSSMFEDTTTNTSKDEFSGSEKASGLLCNWACVGPPEGRSQKREDCPPTKSAKKNFGVRAARRQASREARAWEKGDRRTFKGLCHAEVRDDERKNHLSTYELESQVEAAKQADVNRCTYDQETNLHPDNKGKDVLDWQAADKFKVQKVEKQPCLPCFYPQASMSKIHAEHVKVSDSVSREGKGNFEGILDGHDRRGTEKLKSEYLQDPVWSTSFYTPRTSDFNNSKPTSQNRFREAVEAAWKTSLGTKSEPERNDLNCELISDVGGASQDSPRANSQFVARMTSEHKSSALDDTARVAEEGIRDLLDERAVFRTKFNEELEQGVTDRLRLQELLLLEKFKLETTERELREVKMSFQEALLAGPKAKKRHTSEPRQEHQSVNTRLTSGVVEGRGDTQLKLKSESEARLAAEAKASYFEASAKAAEDKIHSLLKERNWFYSRFKEESEHSDTDKTASKLSMEQDSIRQESSESPRRRKSDARALVASGVAKKPSHGATEDEIGVAQSTLRQNGPRGKASYHPRLKQGLEQKDADRHILHEVQELDESKRRLVKGTEDTNSLVLPLVSSSKQETSPLFERKKALERECQRSHSCSLAASSDSEKQLEAVDCETSDLKNERKRSFSPTSNNSRVEKWEPNLPFTLKIERCRLKDGKTTTTFNISPNFDPRGNSPHNGCKLELTHNEDTASTNCTDESSEFVVKVGNDEELVSRKVRSYTYNISDQQDKHLDVEGEEQEGIKSQGTESEDDQNSVDRRDRFYQRSESDRSRKQSALSAAESTGTTISSEESNAYRHNESDSPRRHPNARDDGTPVAGVYDSGCDAKEQYSPDRHGKSVGSGECSPIRKKVEGFDDRLLLLPSKWKREAKAELRRIIQEQELTWKIAEDAVDELGRRLELLERYKMGLQDNLSRCSVKSDMEQFWTRLEKRFEGSPRGYSSLYHSPIFDDRLGSVERKNSGRTSRQADTFGAISHENQQSNDPEIQKLKTDLADLKNQLRGCRSSRDSSPRKEDFRYSSSSSPPTPPLPPPPPATPATPPTPPTVPDYHHAFQGFSSGRQVPLASEHVRIGPEVVAGVLEAKKVDPKVENVKLVTSQATEKCRNGSSGRKADRHKYYEDPLLEGSHLESRSWVPMPDNETVERYSCVTSDFHENGKRNSCATGQNFECVKSSCVPHPSRRGSGNDNIMTCKVNSDEGEVEVFKDAVRKISNVFWEQEGKLKGFKAAVNIAETDPSQYLEMRNFYLHLLKEMSEQLGELCRDLQTDSCENVDTREALIRPLAEGSEVENLRAALQAAERQVVEEVNITFLLKDKLDAGDRYFSKIKEEHAEEISRKEKTVTFAQQLNLQLANEMSVTESSLAELRTRYKGLVSNLESQLNEAREEVTSLQSTLSDLKVEVARNHSLVIDLERAGQEKESDIKELTERMQAYRNETQTNQSRVIALERAARERELQMEELTERMQAYRHETQTNQSLVIDLEREGQENELQMQELTERMQAHQSETDQLSEEKSELLKNIQDLRREADNQQRRVVELVNINEDLIGFAQTKEDEVKALTKEVANLQHISKGKSDEANKLAVEAAISLRELIEARRDGEVYRVSCQNLKSKLDETEQELISREDALERLTSHLGSTIEGQDLIADEKEQLLLSLSNVQYKERRMDDQIRLSKAIIQDLEEKVSSMEKELTKARITMNEMRVKGKESLAIEKEAGEMRCRVHQLEEEIMEKEGLISILKSSYPGEFESTF